MAEPVADVVLCWDIDGTLLTTDRAGIGAWEDAVRRVTGRARSLAHLRTAGLTDVEIGRAILDTEGVAPDEPVVADLLAHYEERLPTRLGDRCGRVLPGVREFLDWNREAGGLRCMLLTGNTAAGARAKLEHSGLAEFFPRGAYASLSASERVAVARAALGIAQDWLGAAFRPGRMLVIGDTPHDVACGTAVGARTLAVGTGEYSPDELARAGAWRTVARLPEPAALARLAVEDAT